MNLVIPRWALGVLALTSAFATAMGLLIEQSSWADHHPFLINLLSSLATFGASLCFAALVLNRIIRRQYWSAELDRRTRAVSVVEFARRHLAVTMGISAAQGVTPQLRERMAALRLGDGPQEEHNGEVVAAPQIDRSSVEQLRKEVIDCVGLEHRLAFASDGDLIYRTDRLARKWDEFEHAWATLSGPRCADEQLGALYLKALAVSEALDDLQTWMLHAPDRRMRAAVAEGAFRSDLD